MLTHVDDRFDTGMRDAIGADAARVLPLLDTRSFTFLIEDPATVWHLGPERYPAIAERYRALTPHRDKLAIDLNIVERYQNVYPTKQQTGIELFQLVHRAAGSFRAGGAVFREFAAAAGSAAAALGRGRGLAHRADGSEDGGRFRGRRRHSVEGRRQGGWAALAGAGRRNALAAGRSARRRAGAAASPGRGCRA